MVSSKSFLYVRRRSKEVDGKVEEAGGKFEMREEGLVEEDRRESLGKVGFRAMIAGL